MPWGQKTLRPHAAALCSSLRSPSFDEHACTDRRTVRWLRARREGPAAQPTAGVGGLFVNVLAFSGLPTLIPIPTTIGQMVTQGALIVAFLLALLANPHGVIRPNLFMVLLTVLAVVALMVSIHNQFILGSTFRACRLIGFMAVLWLLTRWWGRSDFVLLRSHIGACAS